MKLSENFTLEEFIDPKTFKKFGKKSMWFIDPKIVDIAQLLRDLSGVPVKINDWHKGGRYKLSGLRPLTTSIGALRSQHKYGRGIDVKVEGLIPSEVHKLILDNKREFLAAGLTTMESVKLTTSWTHLDCRWTGMHDIKIVGL